VRLDCWGTPRGIRKSLVYPQLMHPLRGTGKAGVARPRDGPGLQTLGKMLMPLLISLRIRGEGCTIAIVSNPNSLIMLKTMIC
jgi:hypothetical protein